MSPEPLRTGSLFTGTSALDLAVMDVFDAELVWHSQYEPPDKNGKEDLNQYAAQILARHWPAVPNLGDITKVDWQAVIEEHGPVDILTGGFPCTDVSSAGKRAGLTPDTRSGLWNHMAHAIAVLEPRLIIENVEGLLSAPADRGLGLDAEALEEEAKAGRVLRAVGAVLGDLASLGFDAEWVRVGADEVGAPHRRRRIFIYAWPAAVDAGGLGRGDGSRIVGGLGAAGRGPEAAADTADLGHERVGSARNGRPGPADGGVAAADAQGAGLQGLRPESARGGSERGGTTAADADGRGREGHQERDRGPQDGQPERERGLDPVGRGVGRAAVEPACPTCGCAESFHDAGGFCAGPCVGDCTDLELGRPAECPDGCPECAAEAAADAQGVGRNEGRPESTGQQGRSDAAERGVTAPSDADEFGRRADVLQLRPGQPDLDWGDYGPAIRRWEAVLGRPAPWPTDALGRLSPVFTEWLMGLPDGWVTCTPGLTRSAMLRALGNGVVWLQAAAAIRHLHQRAAAPEQQLAAA
ncbi:DNA cytosine methyltransferase [Streptomyces bobili]|uniref:DNA cytosine methyltransferase n=1 Tax=Streptomyces bobili TaxID=67280 RepID=UPI002254B50C|nr:DNA cytosine methyltransferase [Streptomyces bobili]MCX5522638.1 DNA cytosine methyltransferase [Streptomyces bobili]